MENTKAMQDALSKLDGLLGQTDLSDVTSESTGFSELPEGYYLVEVESANLTVSKSSGNPMVAFRFKVVDDGIDLDVDISGNTITKKIKSTKNRKIFLYYAFKDESSVKRFATDMLKFEGETEGESLLPKEAFTTSETLIDALDCLEGMRIYASITSSENDDGTKTNWTNLISWKRAKQLELPI